MPPIRPSRALALALTLLLPGAAQAQGPWSLSAAVAAAGFGGAARVDGNVTVRPAATRLGELRLERRLGRAGLAFTSAVGSPGLRVGDSEVWVEAGPAFDLWTVSLEGTLELARTSRGAVLRLRAGPQLYRWDGDGLPGSRTRVGALAGLGLDLPLGRRTGVDLRGHLAASSSPLETGDLADIGAGPERRTLWMHQVTAAFRLRL